MAESLWTIFDEAVARRGVAGVSVVARPQAEPESHWFPAEQTEPAFLVYSITKTLTATCVLQLCDAGQLALEDSLSRWFPEIDRARDISLRQLLNHTSGVPDYGSLPQYHAAVRTSPSTPWTFEQFARETFGRGLAFEPGQGWLYSNPGYMLLRAIIEAVSGQPYAQVLSERVFRPLRLARSFIAGSVDDLRPLAPAMSRLLSADRSLRDTRLHYHPGWVSHGVVGSTPAEVAHFFDALFAGQLLSSKSLAAMTELVPVPPHPAPGYTGRPSYGLGLMGDPTTVAGPSWGHDGGGPGYRASAQHRAGPGVTVCVLAAIEDFDAQGVASRMLDAIVDQ